MKNQKNYLIAVSGALITALGLYFVKSSGYPDEILTAIPYLFVGIGCVIFGHGTGNIITNQTMKNYPEMRRKREIEKCDERNIMIANRAKAKAYDFMISLFGALIISLGIMGVEIVPTLLLLVIAYLFVVGYAIYRRLKYEREM